MKAGIKIDSPGVVPAGVFFGFGRGTVQTYVAPVSVFKIGDEEIRNTRLLLGDTDLQDADMLIGADFFLSGGSRVFTWANSQDKLYFSYNGGPVFESRGFAGGWRRAERRCSTRWGPGSHPAGGCEAAGRGPLRICPPGCGAQGAARARSGAAGFQSCLRASLGQRRLFLSGALLYRAIKAIRSCARRLGSHDSARSASCRGVAGARRISDTIRR